MLDNKTPHIFSLTFTEGVIKLYNKRENLKQNTPLTYSIKTPFVNFYSNAIVLNDSGKMAKKWMFVNNIINNSDVRGILYQYNKLYRPLPIILNINIETFGDYGALRKATLSIVCFSLLQLLLLLKIYMVPGVTCVLQYGWTSRTNEFIDYSKHYDLNIDDIIKFRKDNDYNSDVILGIISNFSYSLNSSDGSFTINLLLISMGNKFFLLYKQRLSDDTDNEYNIKNLLDIVKAKIPIKIINGKKYILFYFVLLFFREKKIKLNSGLNLYRDNPYLRSIDPDNVFFLIQNDIIKIPNNNKDKYIISICISVLMFLLALQRKDYISILLFILNKINYSTTNWLDLKIKKIGDEIQIVDLNNLLFTLNKNIFLFNIYNSLILSISFLTSLPNLMKQVAVYTRNNLNLSSLMASYIERIWGTNITDRNRFKNKKTNNNTTLSRENEQKFMNHLGNPIINSNFEQLLNFIETGQRVQRRLLEDEQQKITLNVQLILHLRKLMNLNIPKRSGRILPISITITIDGISGILYGNLFKIDYLNNTFLKLSLFVVTQVSDSINLKWSTTITGMLMSKPRG